MSIRFLLRYGIAILWALAVSAASANVHDGNHAAAPSKDFDERQALAYSQTAIGQTVGDYHFIAADGRTVNLTQYRGKPLVISLIYTSCYHTCPMITEALIRSAEAAGDALGINSFSIVTIGFDSKVDTPGRMRTYGSQHSIKLPNWTLLSSDADTMAKLAKDLGFIFYPSSKGYDHLAQTTVLDGEGRVSAQVYGDSFEPPMVIEPIKRLIFGGKAPLTSLEGILGRVRLICTLYDPKSERYHFDYSLLVGIIIGGLCLSAIGAVLIRESWRLHRRTKTERKPT